MIRKYHNQKLQTNPWHREEEPHNNHETQGRQTKQSNQLSLPIEMIAKLKWTQSNAQQNIKNTESRNGSNNQQRTNNNRATALERTAAKVTGVAKMQFTGTKSSPSILLLFKHKNVKLAWRIPNYCNVSS